MGRSPAHYREATQDETTAMERGSAVHSLLLGGRSVIQYPGKVRRGKEWEAFEKANKGCQILTATEFGKVMGMADAVRRHRAAMTVLEGEREKEIDWSYLGRACQSHVDVVGAGFITELKTTVSSDPPRFTMQALRMGYHAQLAFYRQAVISSGSGHPQHAYVVAIESSAPFAVTVMRMTDRALDMGSRLARLWFERLLTCEASDYWPAYTEHVVDLDVPEDLELTFEADADGSSESDS